MGLVTVFREQSRERLYLSLFTAYLVFTHAYWIAADNLPASGDQGNYLKHTTVMRDFILEGKILHVLKISDYRPILTRVLSLPIQQLAGYSVNTALITNIFLLPFLLYSSYGVGKHLRNERAGLIVAFVVGMAPLSFGMAREFLQEFALLTMISVGTYLLLKSEGFTSRKYSIYFGIASGLGMLTKWTYALFILPPLVYTIDWQTPRISLKTPLPSLKIFSLLSFLGVGAGIALNHFVNNMLSYYIQGNFKQFLSEGFAFQSSLNIFIVFSGIVMTLAVSAAVSWLLRFFESHEIWRKTTLVLLPLMLLWTTLLLPALNVKGMQYLYYLAVIGSMIGFSMSYLLVRFIEEGDLPEDKRAWRNILYAGVLTSIIAAIWYIPNLPTFLENIIFAATGHVEVADPARFTLRGILYYPLALNNVILGTGIFLLFLIGVSKFRKNLSTYWTLYILFIFTFALTNKEPRYIIAIIIPAAVLTYDGYERLSDNLQHGKKIATALLLSAVFIHLGLTFGTGIELSTMSPAGPITFYSDQPYGKYLKYDYVHAPYRQDYKEGIRETFEYLNSTDWNPVEDNIYPRYTKSAELIMMNCERTPRGSIFFYYNRKWDYNFKLNSNSLGNSGFIKSKINSEDEYTDYVLYIPCRESYERKKAELVPPSRFEKYLQNKQKNQESMDLVFKNFEVVKTIEWPRNITGYLMRPSSGNITAG